MDAGPQPLVSVVTPVYNGEAFLAECMESVLGQSYGHFEYIVVNNCSTDHSLDIASSFAKKDPRVRIHSNDRFVPVIENHNMAFSLISPVAKYCKVVSADDLIFPDCLMRMVGLAEANPSVAIVGSYEIAGSRVRWQGFQYPRSVMPGREVCRRDFLGGIRRSASAVPLRFCTGLISSGRAAVSILIRRRTQIPAPVSSTSNIPTSDSSTRCFPIAGFTARRRVQDLKISTAIRRRC